MLLAEACLKPSAVSIVGAFVALAGCSSGVDKSTTYWEDAFCDPGNPPPPPFVQTAFVGLFLEDGTPLCRDDATVVVTQDQPLSSEAHRATLLYTTRFFARLAADDGAMHLFSGSDGPCNVYEPATADYAWLRCGPPLQYDVRVEGCEPVGGTFTWNDNWFPWKQSFEQQDWLVPVRMRCGAAPDASVPLDAAGPFDADVPLDASVLSDASTP